MVKSCLPLVALALVACKVPASSTRGDWTPNKTPGAGLRVALGEMRLGVTPGTTIGQVFDEFDSPTGKPLLCPDALSGEQQERFRVAIDRAFAEQGVHLETRHPALGLDSSLDSPAVLELSIASLFMQSRRGAERENYASVGVDWQILDRTTGEILAKNHSSGRGTNSNLPEELQARAMHEAAASFIARREARDVIAQTPAPVVSAAAFRPGELIALGPPPPAATPSSSEQMIAKAAAAVFSIRNPQGHGSGFFIRRDGLALTSRHVIAGRKYWDAFLPDGRAIRLQVVREDAGRDVALLKSCEAGEYEALSLGDSGSLPLGEEIWVIGTPVSLQLSQSISRGIVSGVRTEAERNLIQTDAALNPGSSGGPVLNRLGEVIGIANLKIHAPEVEGIGFCTSINDARAGLLLVLR